MKRFTILFIICILMTAFGAKAQDTLRMSLEDCIRYATENNLSLQTAALNRNTAELNYQRAKQQMAPSVSASASQGFGYMPNSSYTTLEGGTLNESKAATTWSGNYGLNAGIVIFNGLNIYNSIKQSKVNLEQADLQLEKSRNLINVQIVQAFLSVIMNEERLGYLNDVCKTSEEQMKQGEQQFKVGKILESDYMMLEAQYASDSFNIENTKITIENNILRLKNLLCMKPSQPLKLVKPSDEAMAQSLEMPTKSELINQSMQYLPELKLNEKNIESAEYDVKIAKSSYYPSLMFSTGASTGYNSGAGSFGEQLKRRFGLQAGLNLSVPIYNRSNARIQVAQSKIRLQQAEIEGLQTELEVLQTLEENYLNVKEAQNNFKVTEAQEKAYSANYKAYNEKFKAGAITAVDLLQQQTNYLNVMNNYLQNKYSFVLSRKVLDIYMGIPVKL